MLYKLWTHQEISTQEILLLMPCKLFILKSILKRKFKVSLDIFNLLRMKQQLNSLKDTFTRKKDEPLLKFLLKRTFKLVRQDLGPSEDLSHKIHEQLFKGVFSYAEFKRLFNKQKKPFVLTSVKTSLVKTLLKSEGFVYYVNLCIKRLQKTELKEEISWKLYTLVSKWEKLLKCQDMDVFAGICRFIETDRKMKFPWTGNELTDCVYLFREKYLLS